jgi:polysaccharide biosynthesis/export protein
MNRHEATMTALLRLFAVVLVTLTVAGATHAQPSSRPQADNGVPAAGVVVPPDYVIGPEDVLSIVFWRDKDMSADVVVRPDGKISLALLNDIEAAGYTPEQLRANILKAAQKYIADPNATVVVKEIHSRKVFIMGSVARPGSYPIIGNLTVVQLIAQAGGILEYADDKNILITRGDGGQQVRFRFNYRDFVKGKDTRQNIALRPGDTVIVP